jgi:hypothetical protein
MSTRAKTTALALAAVLAAGLAVHADVWDTSMDPDNGVTTDNVLLHGTEQVHDLDGSPFGINSDQDWYGVESHPLSSYQFVVDGLTGDLDLTAADVQRMSAAGGLLASADVLGGGGILSLSWLVADAPAPVQNFVRVRDASCAADCSTLDRYRARFFETTYTVPRFNNTGTQVTVLLLQNGTDRACSAGLHFLAADGSLIASTSAALTPRQLFVLATPSVAPNAAGSIRIAHGCGYGGLSGKAVSVEPATGFTFDTGLVPRPR